MTISGKHRGIFTIEWDWLEEGACCDSHPSFNWDLEDPAIEADCDCGACEGYWRVPVVRAPAVPEEIPQ